MYLKIMSTIDLRYNYAREIQLLFTFTSPELYFWRKWCLKEGNDNCSYAITRLT